MKYSYHGICVWYQMMAPDFWTCKVIAGYRGEKKRESGRMKLDDTHPIHLSAHNGLLSVGVPWHAVTIIGRRNSINVWITRVSATENWYNHNDYHDKKNKRLLFICILLSLVTKLLYERTQKHSRQLQCWVHTWMWSGWQPEETQSGFCIQHVSSGNRLPERWYPDRDDWKEHVCTRLPFLLDIHHFTFFILQHTYGTFINIFSQRGYTVSWVYQPTKNQAESFVMIWCPLGPSDSSCLLLGEHLHVRTTM